MTRRRKHCRRQGKAFNDEHKSVAPVRPTGQSPASHADGACRRGGGRVRAQVPRSSHAVFDPPAGRQDPVDLFESQGRSRILELVPIRYGRMLARPSRFTAAPRGSWRRTWLPLPTGLQVQACGDAHLSNFGAFGSPERALVFDINDFDETVPGPWEWDVKRLVASLEIAGRTTASPTPKARGRCPGQRQRVPPRRREIRRHGQPRCLVRQPRHATNHVARLKRRRSRRRGKDARRKPSPRPAPGTTCRRSKSHPVGWRPAARFSVDPPLIVPVEDLFGGKRIDCRVLRNEALLDPAWLPKDPATDRQPPPGAIPLRPYRA